MDPSDECIHGLGPVYACTICNGKDKAAREEQQWRFFPAKWPGQCRGCNLPIHIGQTVGWTADDPVVHAACVTR